MNWKPAGPEPGRCRVLFCLFFFTLPTPFLSPAPASSGEVSKGVSSEISSERKKSLVYLLRQDCGSCHGLTLKGGLGPPLLPAALKGKEAEDLTRIILEGVPGTPMSAWRGLLNQAEAHWLAITIKEGLGN